MFSVPDTAGLTKLNFSLLDVSDDASATTPEIKGTIRHGEQFLEIMVEGYGEKTAVVGAGAVCLFEYRDKKLRLLVFNDINKEEPVYIDLEGAREEMRDLEDNPDLPIKQFQVVVSKAYYRKRSPDTERYIFGSISVPAKDQEDACLIVRKMMTDEDNRLQTVDPRITWEESISSGWGLVDFSFCVEDDIAAEDLDLPLSDSLKVAVSHITWKTDGMDAVADCNLPTIVELEISKCVEISLLQEAVGIKLHDNYGFNPITFKVTI
jgi:hypothetical protein